VASRRKEKKSGEHSKNKLEKHNEESKRTKFPVSFEEDLHD
jgi:hypothetical protein